MKLTVNKSNNIQLEEVFNSIVLKTDDGEEMRISMRDSGFEFQYQGIWYSAKQGNLEKINNKTRYLDIENDLGNIDNINKH